MDVMEKINNKIDLSYLLTIISGGSLIVSSMMALAGVIFNAPGNIRLFVLIGQTLSFIGMIFFAMGVKSLKADRNVIFDCFTTITIINNMIAEIRDEIDFNTSDGQNLFDIVVECEYSIRNLISKMGRSNGNDLRFSVQFELVNMLIKLRLYQSLYCENKKKHTTNFKIRKNSNSKYLNILGLAENVTDWNIIKSTYRKLVKQYHTDVNQTSSAEELIKGINVAYSELEKQFA